jgi:hypothetical protein
MIWTIKNPTEETMEVSVFSPETDQGQVCTDRNEQRSDAWAWHYVATYGKIFDVVKFQNKTYVILKEIND